MRFKTTRTHPPAQPKQRQAPLGDQRYQELVAKAAAFFADAERDVERDVEAEKAAAIAEIVGLMAQYGISPDDLRD